MIFKFIILSMIAISSLKADQSMINPRHFTTDPTYDIEVANDYYNKDDFENASRMYQKAYKKFVPDGKVIAEIKDTLSRESLILYCEAFQGFLNCHLRIKGIDDFYVGNLDTLSVIDPRSSDITIINDIIRIKIDDLTPEDLKYFLQFNEDQDHELLSVDDTYLTVRFNNKQCDSCCDSCAEGSSCQDLELDEFDEFDNFEEEVEAFLKEMEKKNLTLIPKKHKKSVKRCREHCQIMGGLLLSYVRGNIATKAIAAKAMKVLIEKCENCCKKKGFYKNCVKPVQNFTVSSIDRFVKPHNDPAFNDPYDDYINGYVMKVGTTSWLPIGRPKKIGSK